MWLVLFKPRNSYFCFLCFEVEYETQIDLIVPDGICIFSISNGIFFERTFNI